MAPFMDPSTSFVGEGLADRGVRSATIRVGLKTVEVGGFRLNLRLEVDIEGLGLFMGSITRNEEFLGTLNLRGETSSGSSGTASTVLGGRERFDIRTTFDRLWPFLRDDVLFGLVCVALVCIASCGDH